MSGPVGTWVKGQSSPVFGVDRPGSVGGVIIDVARYSNVPVTHAVEFNQTWTMTPVAITKNTRFYCTATMYLFFAGFFSPTMQWDDGSLLQFLDGQRESSTEFIPFTSDINLDRFYGGIFTYQAMFDYVEGDSAVPSFTFSFTPFSDRIPEENGTLTAVLTTVRGIPGETV